MNRIRNRNARENSPPLFVLTPVASDQVTDAVLTPDDLMRVWGASAGLAVADLPVEGHIAISNPGRPGAA